MDNIYSINVPYLSNGLRRSYYKNLEIFELKFDVSKKHYFAFQVHTFKKGVWVVNAYNKYLRINPNRTIHTELVQRSFKGTLEFFDIELAKMTKLILIQRLKRTYYDEIQRIAELMERNIPDVQDILNEYKELYPEYFI